MSELPDLRRDWRDIKLPTEDWQQLLAPADTPASFEWHGIKIIADAGVPPDTLVVAGHDAFGARMIGIMRLDEYDSYWVDVCDHDIMAATRDIARGTR